jgi:hypothetical protein
MAIGAEGRRTALGQTVAVSAIVPPAAIIGGESASNRHGEGEGSGGGDGGGDGDAGMAAAIEALTFKKAGLDLI